MKVIYLLGSTLAGNLWSMQRNISNAQQWAYKLWQMGYAVICPQLNGLFMNDSLGRIYVQGNMEIVKRCDAIFKYDKSFKYFTEIERVCSENKIPVFDSLDKMYKDLI